jgi:hypothetical protein
MIRGKAQDIQRDNNPGPGNYDPNESKIKYQSPSYKIDGGSKRVGLVSADQYSLPGPGGYD